MNDLPVEIILPDARDEPRLDSLDIRPRSWIKRILPRTMFGRSLLLIVVPLIVVQIVSAWVFYARHWETMSRRLSSDVAGDIALVIEGMKSARSDVELAQLMERASSQTETTFSFDPFGMLPDPTLPSGNQS